MVTGSKKTGSFVVMLDNTKHAPTLLTKARPVKDEKGKIKEGFFEISVIHPNTNEVLYLQEHKCKDIYEALKLAQEIKEKPEIKQTKTWYQETLFIPQPKKGKMALKSMDDGEPAKKRGRPAKAKEESKKVVKEDKKVKEIKVEKKKVVKEAKKAKKATKIDRKPKKASKKASKGVKKGDKKKKTKKK